MGPNHHAHGSPGKALADEQQAVAELRQSEARYRLLADHVRVVLWEIDPTPYPLDLEHFRLTYVTEFAEQLLGFSRAEWCAPGFCASHLHPDDRMRVIEYCGRCIAAMQDHRIEFRMMAADGRVVWIENVVKVVSADDHATALRGVLIDVTERKRAEESLRESEERFRGAFECAAIGMAIVAPSGRWLRVNRSLCEIVGYTEEELLARDFQSITHPDDLDTDLDFVCQMLAGTIPYYHLEKRYFHKSGRIVWILLSVSLVRDGQGQPLYFISQIQDVTQRKQTVATLQAYNERLRALSHQILQTQETERRRLARELHDEIGQMLTTLGIRLHQLKSQCAGGPNQQAMQSSLDEDIDFVNRTIDQVREASLNLRPPMLDVLGLEATLRWHAEHLSQRTGLNVRILGHLEEKRLPAELEIACYRIVQEALTNVVRHAQATQATVELRRLNGELQLIVGDNGVGFDVAAAQERAGRGGSFGVLALCERAELLGGRVEIDAVVGRGTRVCATFPMGQA